MDGVSGGGLGDGCVVCKADVGEFGNSACVGGFCVCDVGFDEGGGDVGVDEDGGGVLVVPGGVDGDELAEGEVEGGGL